MGDILVEVLLSIALAGVVGLAGALWRLWGVQNKLVVQVDFMHKGSVSTEQIRAIVKDELKPVIRNTELMEKSIHEMQASVGGRRNRD